MLSSDDFIKLFRTEISPILDTYEDERKKRLFLTRLLTPVPWLLLLLFFILLFSEYTIPLDIVFWVFILIPIIKRLIKKDFEKKIKIQVMPLICNLFGDFEWVSGSFLGCLTTDTEASASNLIPRYDFGVVDDAFKGNYNNVIYRILEVKFHRAVHPAFLSLIIFLQRLKIIKKSVFSGAIIKIEMNKSFNGNTVIKSNPLFSPSKKLKRTVMEDIVFEKSYDVFTDDEIEARYLITTAFMERLNNIKLAFSANEISCSFYNKYFLIGIETKNDLFSIGDLTKPVNDATQFFNMYYEIQSIIKLIDHFHLDKKIGL